MSAHITGMKPANAELFQQATTYALAVVAQVSEDDLDRPTHCTDWTIGDLLAHLVDVAEALRKLADTGTLELTAKQRPDSNIVNAVRDRMDALIDRLNGGAETIESAGVTEPDWVDNAAISGAVEFTTHGWDISAALGQPRQIPDALAKPLLAITSQAIDNANRAPQFAPPVDVDPSHPSSDQLLGFLGRNPHPTESDGLI